MQTDRVRVNGFFRAYLGPIACTPVEADGRRFYRAQGLANGPEMLTRLGLTQAFDLGGCGGALATACKLSLDFRWEVTV